MYTVNLAPELSLISICPVCWQGCTAIPDSSMEPSQRGQGTILLVEDEPGHSEND